MTTSPVFCSIARRPLVHPPASASLEARSQPRHFLSYFFHPPRRSLFHFSPGPPHFSLPAPLPASHQRWTSAVRALAMSFTPDFNQSYPRPAIQVDDYGDALNAHGDSLDTTRSLATRTPFYASSSSSSTEMNANRADRPSPNAALIYPLAVNKSNPSICSTATATPIPSRTASPLYMQDDAGSTYSSDTDEENELESRLLPDSHRRTFSLTNAPRWWTGGLGGSSRRRRRDVLEYGTWRWAFRTYILPFIPKTPLTIVRLPHCMYAMNSADVPSAVIHPAIIDCIRHFSYSPHHIPLQSGQAASAVAWILYDTQLFNRASAIIPGTVRLVPNRTAERDFRAHVISPRQPGDSVASRYICRRVQHGHGY